MSGSNLFLDTNAFIYFFEGRNKITKLILQTAQLFYSPISEIELLSSPKLSDSESQRIKGFLNMCHRVELSQDVINTAIDLRKRYRLRTPDAIVAASALSSNMALATADSDFAKVSNLTIEHDILN